MFNCFKLLLHFEVTATMLRSLYSALIRLVSTVALKVVLCDDEHVTTLMRR